MKLFYNKILEINIFKIRYLRNFFLINLVFTFFSLQLDNTNIYFGLFLRRHRGERSDRDRGERDKSSRSDKDRDRSRSEHRVSSSSQKVS